jgi:AraC-like DNA-binding protein
MPARRYGAIPPSIEADNRATVAAGFVRGLLSGLPPPRAEDMLDGAGLSRRHLDDAVRTPIAAYAALYNAVVRELSDEGFGLFGSPLRPGTFEFLCRGTIGAPTLGLALARAAQFLAVVLPDLEVRVESRNEVARIEIREPHRLGAGDSDPRRVFAYEWLLRMLHGLACWLAGRSLALDSVAFPYPRPAHATEYARVYTEHSAFDAPCLEARLEARLLGLPVRRTEAELATFLEGAPGKIAMLYRRDREMALAVREQLSASLKDAPGFDQVAAALHLSTRSLHRRLAEEGTSFRRIRERLRRDQAVQRLEKTKQSVGEIAEALGYSEPSAFFRAFVGWTGVAPTSYRKRATEGS